MSVISKMRVASVEDFGTSRQVKLQCVYDPTGIPENQRFTRATPWGECKMSIDNPAAFEQFGIGKEFYVTFDEVRKEAEA